MHSLWQWSVFTLLADSDTHFIGAQNEFIRALQKLDPQKIHFIINEIRADWTWMFNPPAASYIGRAWEKQTLTARRTSSGLLNDPDTSLNDESLTTLMVKVETIMNSRPWSVETINDVNSPLLCLQSSSWNLKQKWFYHHQVNSQLLFPQAMVGHRNAFKNVKWSTNRWDFKIGDVVKGNTVISIALG